MGVWHLLFVAVRLFFIYLTMSLYWQLLCSTQCALRLALSSGLVGSAAGLPSADDGIDDFLHTVIVPHRGEKRWSAIPHFGSIATHNIERGADVGC